MMSLDAFVPKDVTNRMAETFLNALIAQPVELRERMEDESPLQSQDIELIGKAIVPCRKSKQAVNGLIHDVVQCFGNFDRQLKIERWYVAGDYARRTAVGKFRDVQLIAYVQFGEHTVDHASDAVYNHLEKVYSYRRNHPIEDVVVCDVKRLKHTVMVTCHPTSVTIILADARYSSGSPDAGVAALLPAYESLLLTPPDSAYDIMRGSFQEASDRYIQTLPEPWICFIRFVKYWSLLNLHDLITMDAVETMALKLLLQEDPTEGSCDLLKLFQHFLIVLCNPKSLVELNKITLSKTAFHKNELKQRKQPLMEVSWESYEPYPASRSSVPVVLCGLHHPTLNLVANVMDCEWEAIGSIVASVKDRGTATNRQLSLQDTFIHVKRQGQASKPARSPARTTRSWCVQLIKSLAKMVLVTGVSFMIFLITGLGCLLEAPNGTLPKTSFARVAGDCESVYIKGTSWLLVHDLQPLVDSPAFSCVEDIVGLTLDKVKEVPDLWEYHVPLSLRSQIVKSRDHYTSLIVSAYSHIGPTVTLMKRYMEAKYAEFTE